MKLTKASWAFPFRITRLRFTFVAKPVWERRQEREWPRSWRLIRAQQFRRAALQKDAPDV